ncbi:MAG: hypothetical protein IJ668_09030 [Selenomonadaceae bacterium]|nr:hypothetical protein [Selenomonadaceae bacterium]
MSDVIEKYNRAKKQAVADFDELGVYGYAGEMYSVLKELLEEIEDEPRGFEYAFLSVEYAQLDIDGRIYADAKKYALAAYDALSNAEASSETEKLLFHALKIIVRSCNELDDWSGVDQLKVTRLDYELSKKYPIPDSLFSESTPVLNYADALLNVDQLSEHEELRRTIFDELDELERLSKSDDILSVVSARKLKRILIAFGEPKLAQKIYERILLKKVESLSDNIDNGEDSDVQDWNLRQADVAIELLKELGRDKDVKRWERRRELIEKPWKRLP